MKYHVNEKQHGNALLLQRKRMSVFQMIRPLTRFVAGSTTDIFISPILIAFTHHTHIHTQSSIASSLFHVGYLNITHYSLDIFLLSINSTISLFPSLLRSLLLFLLVITFPFPLLFSSSFHPLFFYILLTIFL